MHGIAAYGMLAYLKKISFDCKQMREECNASNNNIPSNELNWEFCVHANLNASYKSRKKKERV